LWHLSTVSKKIFVISQVWSTQVWNTLKSQFMIGMAH